MRDREIELWHRLQTGWEKWAAMLPQLMNGMAVTVQIFVVTLVFSLPLGLLVSFGRMAKNPVIRWITKAYISIMRGTPLMLQLFIVYFGPYYIFRIRVTNDYRLWAVFIGFVINYAAYFAEIYRSGIQSMPVGQYEAAKLLGYNRFQTFFKIIFPQVIKRILPSVTNEVITLVKDTSLAFTISVIEDVYRRQAAGLRPGGHDALRGGGDLLLCVQSAGGCGDGIFREKTVLLSVVGGRICICWK